jgi:hypothetical protein
MAAPTNAAKCEESSCQPGAVHTWHKGDAPFHNLRCRNEAVVGESRPRNKRLYNGFDREP